MSTPSSRPLRIAFARIAQESNAFSPVHSTLDDFRRSHWLEGDALMAACSPKGKEVPGFVKDAELSGFVKACAEEPRVQAVPLSSLWAVPSGPLTEDTLRELIARLCGELKGAMAAGIDGLFLSLHGAMCALGTDDPEADLLEAVRGVVGDIPVGVSLDLHAVLTKRMMEAVTFVAGYRTNPHRDHATVGYRAGRVLVDTVLGRVKPTMAWRSLPMILGGGTTIDFLPTMRPIYREKRRSEKGGALYASTFNSHLWATHPEMGWASTVVTDDDPALADAIAESLADALWSVRKVPLPDLPEAAEAVEQARSAKLARTAGTVCMCDASDIVGCGAPGDNTLLLEELLKRGGDLRSYVPVRDPLAAKELFELPIGARVTRTVGGGLAPEYSSPLGVEGVVAAKHQHEVFGKRVRLDCGKTSILVTEGPTMAMKPAFFRDLGLRIRAADVIVVKSMFPFRLYFLPWNRKTIYAKSRGASSFDVGLKTAFDRDVWPQVDVPDWRPVDRERRGVA